MTIDPYLPPPGPLPSSAGARQSFQPQALESRLQTFCQTSIAGQSGPPRRGRRPRSSPGSSGTPTRLWCSRCTAVSCRANTIVTSGSRSLRCRTPSRPKYRQSDFGTLNSSHSGHSKTQHPMPFEAVPPDAQWPTGGPHPEDVLSVSDHTIDHRCWERPTLVVYLGLPNGRCFAPSSLAPMNLLRWLLY